MTAHNTTVLSLGFVAVCLMRYATAIGMTKAQCAVMIYTSAEAKLSHTCSSMSNRNIDINIHMSRCFRPNHTPAKKSNTMTASNA